MSKPIIFDIKNKKTIKPNNLNLEKQLQNIIEQNMESIFGVKFLASEYTFKDNVNGEGRIDSLGLDESNRPVVIEYKLSENKTVINQTLFYMDWLKDHKADFELLVLQKFGKDVKEKIEWVPRGICIAETFTKYDNGAVNQMNVDISLIQYYIYGENHELIAFESMNRIIHDNSNNSNQYNSYEHQTYSYIYNNLDATLKGLVDEISFRILNIAEDVSESELKYYKAFKTIKNFASLVLNKSKIKIYLNIDYNHDNMKDFNNIKDVKNKGHWGNGNIEISINNIDEFNSIFHFIKESYDIN
ncbi:MAG: hypothetical protein H9897_01490 [Candidatus Ureaplasma intestinipullorum]|uniref:DUF5655 domain-containing protein n=1 Tax=Candidatus Ureaplasma intestinipullorum TaxID=2838770 RepID=A0A9E2NW05_9BACT|nr:hypothetical protein [Candidatus Ureaplasma intestinipullorum]